MPFDTSVVWNEKIVRKTRISREGKSKALAIFIIAIMIMATIIAAINITVIEPDIPATEPTPVWNAALNATETVLLGTRNLYNVWRNSSYLVDGLQEKITGSAKEWTGQQYIYNALNNLSLDRVLWESFNTSSFNHTGDKMTVVGPSTDIPCVIYGNSYGIWGYNNGTYYSFGNLMGGTVLQAGLIDANYGTKADFDALGGAVVGKIALVHRWDDTTYWPSVMNDEAYLHGAVATINYDYGDDGAANPAGIKQDDVGGSIPCYSISINSANALKALLGGGAVTLRLEGRADFFGYGTVQSSNVMGFLNGSRYPDEYVVISSHVDTFWNGSFDTCSGIACMLEFARIFSEAKAAGTFTNERTLVFVSVGGEECGGIDGTWFSWLVGTYELYLAHPEIADGLVVDLNMDGPSLEKSSGQYWAEVCPEIVDFFNAVTSDLGHGGAVGCSSPLWSWTDAWIYNSRMGGSAMNIWWENDYTALYHTNLDDMSRYSNVSIDLALEFYIVMAARASNNLVYPLNLLATVDWIRDGTWGDPEDAVGLNNDAGRVTYKASWFANTSTALAELRANITLMNTYAAQLQADYDAATTEAERNWVRWNASWLNDAIRDARKWINQWGYGEGGEMASWNVLVRPDQHSSDILAIDEAIKDFNKGTPAARTAALVHLTEIYTMAWGNLFSNWTFHSTYQWMYNDAMYWGAENDMQQAYVDVWWIWTGVTNGTLSVANAILRLNEIRNNLLLPWLQTDLLVMEHAFDNASAAIVAGMSPPAIPEPPIIVMAFTACATVLLLVGRRRKKE